MTRPITREELGATLEQTRGNLAEAARLLQIDRMVLTRKARAFGFQPKARGKLPGNPPPLVCRFCGGAISGLYQAKVQGAHWHWRCDQNCNP